MIKNFLVDYHDSPELEYVSKLGKEFLPNIHFDIDSDNEEWATPQFFQRYNDKLIDNNFTYQELLLNTDIHKTLAAYHVDMEKFWYLLLFIYDYTLGSCQDGIKKVISPRKEIGELMRNIKDNIICGNIITTKFKNQMTLELKIDGVKRKVKVKEPNSFRFLLDMFDVTNKSDDTHFDYIDSSPCDLEKEEMSDIYWLLCFTKLFRFFLFEVIKEEKPNSQAYQAVSFDKTLLISRLFYFTRLSRDKRYLESGFLQNQLKKYKDAEIKTINGRYY